MKRFKGFIAIAMVCLLGAFGCAAIQPYISKAETGVCSATAYYESYIAGVAGVVELAPVVGSYVADANALIAVLDKACKSGATLASMADTVSTIEAVIKQINATAGKAKTAVPTPAKK